MALKSKPAVPLCFIYCVAFYTNMLEDVFDVSKSAYVGAIAHRRKIDLVFSLLPQL